jgi:methylmalonyl-CoA mutase C-terminal domain/subunit
MTPCKVQPATNSTSPRAKAIGASYTLRAFLAAQTECNIPVHARILIASFTCSRFPTSMTRPIRILVAKPGLDGHDRGAKVVAAALRDAGMEVIYTGLHQTPEMIATAAVQEDVDVVGLSILSGAHMTLFPRVLQLLREAGRDDILITGGGIIPKEDMDTLTGQGIGRLFGPGTPTQDLIDYIRGWFAERQRQEA